MAKKSQQQIRADITEQFVAAIQEETPPWRKPWSNKTNMGMPKNFQSGRRYTGINPLLLMLTVMSGECSSCNWGTYNSWKKSIGANVRKGEKSTKVVLFKFLPRRSKDGSVMYDDNGNEMKFPMMSQFPVFNADQLQAPDVESLLDGRCKKGRFGSAIRGLLSPGSNSARKEVVTVEELKQIVSMYVPKSMLSKEEKNREELAQLIHDGIKANVEKYQSSVVQQNDDPDFVPAEDFIEAVGANIKDSNKAAYNLSEDCIKMPEKKSFTTMSDYYETLFHEMAHWCEKKSRVGRKENHEYAFGELVAEIAACFLMMELGVPLAEEMTEHSKGYVKHWMQAMTSKDPSDNGSKYIFDASTQASKVVDYLLGFVGKENVEYEETRRVA